MQVKYRFCIDLLIKSKRGPNKGNLLQGVFIPKLLIIH